MSALTLTPMTTRERVAYLSTLLVGDPVWVLLDGRKNAMKVTRDVRRSDGKFGSWESSRVTISYGPGRYSFEIIGDHREPFGRLGYCATIDCLNLSRWYPIAEANTWGNDAPQRCERCCDLIPMERPTYTLTEAHNMRLVTN